MGSSKIEIKAIVENPVPGTTYQYQWFKRTGTDKTIDKVIRIELNRTAKSSVLEFHDLTIDDDGRYTCQVSDGFDTVISAKPCRVRVVAESPCKIYI